MWLFCGVYGWIWNHVGFLTASCTDHWSMAVILCHNYLVHTCECFHRIFTTSLRFQGFKLHHHLVEKEIHHPVCSKMQLQYKS
ncbi:hypothetical protein DFH06DRAFT_727164 [Mycena polygramma]|nr:hypothetical protein DFH06DRAFT_727164 [Mycena polygramma]